MKYAKIAAACLFVVFCAVALFVSGAYFAGRFSASIFSPPFGQRMLAQAAEDNVLLLEIDTNEIDKAREILLLRQDSNILSLNSVSSYMSPEMKKRTCRIIRTIAKQRTRYADAKSSHGVLESYKVVKAVLENPVACRNPISDSSGGTNAPQTDQNLP